MCVQVCMSSASEARKDGLSCNVAMEQARVVAEGPSAWCLLACLGVRGDFCEEK